MGDMLKRIYRPVKKRDANISCGFDAGFLEKCAQWDPVVNARIAIDYSTN